MSVWWAMYREDAQSERADEPLSLIRDEKAAKKWGEWLAQLGPPLYVVKPVKIHVEQFEVAVIKPLIDSELQSLNPGIRKTVQWLRSHGYYTTDSGDGKTHEYECDLPEPYVHMLAAPERMIEESRRLVRLLTEAGIKLGEIHYDESGKIVTPPHIESSYMPGCHIESKYWPLSEAAIISLYEVDDEMMTAAEQKEEVRDA